MCTSESACVCQDPAPVICWRQYQVNSSVPSGTVQPGVSRHVLRHMFLPPPCPSCSGSGEIHIKADSVCSLQAAIADMRKACAYDTTAVRLQHNEVYKHAQQLNASVPTEIVNEAVSAALTQDLKSAGSIKQMFSRAVRIKLLYLLRRQRWA